MESRFGRIVASASSHKWQAYDWLQKGLDVSPTDETMHYLPAMFSREPAKPDRSLLSHGSKSQTGFISYDYGAYSSMIFRYFLGLSKSGNPLPQRTWEAIERAMRGASANSIPAQVHPVGRSNLASRPVRRAAGNQV